MRIHDPACFALLIPTFNGTDFLRRTLAYLRATGFTGQIVLSDNSSGEHRAFVESCAGSYPDLKVRVYLYEPSIRFLDKLRLTLESIESRNVMLHAHDDFMVAEGVEECVELLEQRPEYSTARGRVAMFAIEHRSGTDFAVSFVPHPMRPYEQDDGVERVIAHLENYASTFYSVHRRRNLIESFAFTEESTQNVIFFQYLSSCVAAFQGKISCADTLYYIRQGHGRSWSAQLKIAADYEHWPLLLVSPEFSRHYQAFRTALCAFVARSGHAASPDLPARVDRAAIGLMRRGFCGIEEHNPAELRFLERFKNPESKESLHVRRAVDLALKHPATL